MRRDHQKENKMLGRPERVVNVSTVTGNKVIKTASEKKQLLSITHVARRPRSGELPTQKLKFHLVRTPSLNLLPLKPGVGQYIARHATLTARDFFLAYFYLAVHSPAFFSPKPLPIFPVLAVANIGSCVGPQNKLGHPAGCSFPC